MRLYPKPGQIDQIKINQVEITWNPDDERYYVAEGEKPLGNYKDWRNATARLRKKVFQPLKG